MRVILKQKITFKGTPIEKGTEGRVIAVTNSKSMKADFPCFVDGEGFYYIVKFVGMPDFLVDKSKLELS